MKQLIKFCLLFSFSLTLFSCDILTNTETNAPKNETGPIITAAASVIQSRSELIPGEYIVVFKHKVNSNSHSRAEAALGRQGLSLPLVVTHIYDYSIQGFSGKIPADKLQTLLDDPDIAYIEPNKTVTIAKKPGTPGGGKGGAETTQVVPTGINRVNGGKSALEKRVWILDTGVDTEHRDLTVDAAQGYSAFGGSVDDDHGHGTHVAGIVAAIDNEFDVIGVAAGATVIPIKVLNRNGSGTLDGVISGVEFVAANANPGEVANMSLGGGVSQSLDDAVINASNLTIRKENGEGITGGVHFVLAAGNESDDADNHSPARANGDYIYTVAAIDNNDEFAYFSNYGSEIVDYAEPGVNILSLNKGRGTKTGKGTTTMSGTSMAAPHLAGILLLGSVQSGGITTDPTGGNINIGVH